MHEDPIAPAIDRINRATMSSAEAVRRYANNHEVWPPEQVLWDRLRPQVRGRPILDLGVGGGRTVPALLAVSEDYIGLDYTQAMVDTCRRRFPAVRFEHGDARDLSRFPDKHFALVTFTCNGLDMMGHDDRLRVLHQVHRVLKPGGAFVFTSNNQDSPKHQPGLRLPPFAFCKNPLRLLVRTARFVCHAARSAYNHRRYSRYDVRREEYSLLNDSSHDYGVMVYYISLPNARRQLAAAGFLPDAEAYDLSGRPVVGDTRDVAICYLARKGSANP